MGFFCFRLTENSAAKSRTHWKTQHVEVQRGNDIIFDSPFKPNRQRRRNQIERNFFLVGNTIRLTGILFARGCALTGDAKLVLLSVFFLTRVDVFYEGAGLARKMNATAALEKGAGERDGGGEENSTPLR